MRRLKEFLGVAAIFVFLLGPAIIFEQYWLAAVFGVFGLCFGVIEFVAVKATGYSVSQHFWIWSRDNKKRAWILLAGMFIGWVFLLYHLAFKHLL